MTHHADNSVLLVFIWYIHYLADWSLSKHSACISKMSRKSSKSRLIYCVVRKT